MSESEDELDKFMMGIEIQIKEAELKESSTVLQKGVRTDIEEDNADAEIYEKLQDSITQRKIAEGLLEYDSDGNPVEVNKKEILPLPSVDHSKITYQKFKKCFYTAHNDILQLSESQISDLKKQYSIQTFGFDVPSPVISFGYFNFDQKLIDAIIQHGYHSPTPIQSQAIPVALCGRDIIGIAQTGSGKTAAFLFPMIIHTINQPDLQQGDGPIALVCAPTRELAHQIHYEARKFASPFNLTVTFVFGGGNMHEQSLNLKKGCHILIATPGRLIDLVKSNSTNLRRVTYLIFDEADRMFDMGFGPQVKSIANTIRPDRQCLLFSATFKKKIEKLSRAILYDPVKIVIGEIGEANEDILQLTQFFTKEKDKLEWLLKNLVGFVDAGSVLIFVTKKINCEELAHELVKYGHKLSLLHGDYTQFEREKEMKKFRNKECKILVATDVAARGIDIPSIHTVVNYDVARDITTHTHRIGRTGRAGEKGVAYTLLTPEDKLFIPDYVKLVESSNQEVMKEVVDIALKNEWFRNKRSKFSKKESAPSQNVKQRPGLGFVDSSSISKDANINVAKGKVGKARLDAVKQSYMVLFIFV